MTYMVEDSRSSRRRGDMSLAGVDDYIQCTPSVYLQGVSSNITRTRSKDEVCDSSIRRDSR